MELDSCDAVEAMLLTQYALDDSSVFHLSPSSGPI
eukprot:CAMPEP_0182812980 /NCGR_PEP_ID=MMETSP0006_2-20121128/9096_1 /TAXON_ID=97485 /ORGANISM="Prymnesium parvum, Strain Texoma1" /LENGTH=34 /DNA_ID= /DNA_START= /DNA_END= /DNA_ORIENTATION=